MFIRNDRGYLKHICIRVKTCNHSKSLYFCLLYTSHIILIMTDQQRADAIGCMGNDAVISPNLDAIAAEGTLLMNGYSSCPSSTPARACLLTGLSPWHHGLLGYG